MLTNYRSDVSEAEVDMTGFASPNGVEISTYLINDEYDLELVNKTTVTGDKYTVCNKIKENNVVLLKIRKL